MGADRHQIDKSLHDLINLYLVGEISDEQFKKLEQLLLEDRVHRDEFRHMASMDAGLRDLASQMTVSVEDRSKSLLGNGLPKKWLWIFSLAAVFMIVITVGFLLRNRNIEEEPHLERQVMADSHTQTVKDQSLAMLTQALDDVWLEETAVTMGDRLAAGHLKADHGLFQIDFHSGATMIVQAPFDLELINASQVRCFKGTFRLHVPYHARGFRVFTSQMEVVDLGTEFGLSVQDNGCDLQVFDGQVQVFNDQDKDKGLMLRTGQGFTSGSKPTDKAVLFPTPQEVALQGNSFLSNKYAQWKKKQQELLSDPSLRLLYTFDKPQEWDRRLINQVVQAGPQTEGTLSGGRWADGRFGFNQAFEFKQASDHVRIFEGNDLRSFTLMTWIRIDGFDRHYNSLMASNDWLPGGIHWNFLQEGNIEISIKQSDGYWTARTASVLGQSMLGHWIHLAVTYDGRTDLFTHYLNGVELESESGLRKASQESMLYDMKTTPRIGTAQIGNWKAYEPGRLRNLNGRMDFFAVWNRVLSREQIQEIFLAGNPGK